LNTSMAMILSALLPNEKLHFRRRRLLDWAVQICDVLEMLHAYEPAPIIFRDLKPSNIMTRSTGKIALIDFGIARTFQVAQRGTMIGTEGYAPPEQYRGLADARGDIYALGATLHHLVTDSDPRQQTPFTFHERPVQSLNPDVSGEFADIVSRMLAYHPDQRYQTVKEVRQAIESLQRRSDDPPQIFPDTRLALTSNEPATTMPTDPPVVSRGRVDRRRPSRKRIMRKQGALEQVSERIAWTVATGDEVRGTAAFDGDNVFIGSYDRHLYCLAPQDGSVRWKFETGRGVVARPAISSGAVLVGSEDSAVYCLQVRDGRERWQHRTSMPVRSSPAVHGDRVIVGSDDGVIYAFDLEGGEAIWRHRTWGPIRSTPVLASGKVIVGGDDGYLYALDADNGSVIWRKQCGGAVQSEPATADATIVTSSRSGVVAGFDCQTGSRIWTYQASAPVVSSPRVSGDSVIIGVADGALVALNLADGQVKWIQRYANQITSTPLLGLTAGYIGTVDGTFLAFSVESGDLIWKHDLGGKIVSSPCYAGARLVIGSTDCRVYGLSLADWEIQELGVEKASV
jgi:eukaryotic-like serine/threonine-protein kinase